MKTVLLGVRSLEDSLEGFRSAWATINFASPALLWQLPTTQRWEVLRAM